MKIILSTPLYPPEIGGPATYIKELAERLQSKHQITIVAYANAGETIPGTTLVTVSKRRPLPIRLVKFLISLYKASKEADVIYAQNAVAAGLPSIIVGALRKIPVVIKFVGDEAWERATQLRITSRPLEDFLEKPEGNLRIRLIMKLQGFVLRRANAVTTPSKYLGEAIIRTYGLNKNKVVINYNAAEKTEIVPFKAEVVPNQIVVTARLVEWKGIAGVIKAVAILKAEFPSIHLLVAGDGPEENNLKALAEKLQLQKEVTFLGRVSRAETWHIRKQSEVYVLNSSYEGLPHTALTSFAAEIAIVATDIPGTNEAVYHEKTGLLVKLGDEEALALAIARLLKNPELRNQLIAGAKKIVSEKFSWEAHLKTLNEILQSVIAKPGN